MPLMRNTWHGLTQWVLLACLVLAPAVAHSQNLPKDIHGEFLLPTTNAPAPAVIILHGRLGLVRQKLGKALTEQGYGVLILEYFGESGEQPQNRKAMRRHWPTWIDRINKAQDYLAGHPRIRADSIGIIGFSLGGFLGIHYAGTVPGISAVVEFYGGATPQLDTYVEKLPPVLILHGEGDMIVKVQKGRELHAAMKAAGRTVEMKLYPAASHCFDCDAYGLPYDEQATQDAHRRMFAFLRTHLSK